MNENEAKEMEVIRELDQLMMSLVSILGSLYFLNNELGEEFFKATIEELTRKFEAAKKICNSNEIKEQFGDLKQ